MAETVEETFETEVRRKVTRTAFKIEEVSHQTGPRFRFGFERMAIKITLLDHVSDDYKLPQLKPGHFERIEENKCWSTPAQEAQIGNRRAVFLSNLIYVTHAVLFRPSLT